MDADLAYNNVDFIPDGATYPDRWADAARAHREIEANLGRARLNASYGAGPREKLDIFHPAGRAQGLVVFVHGGYWLKFDRSFWSHLAVGATRRDWAVAMPSYPLAPDAPIPDITRAIVRAIQTAAGFVTGPIRLAGHSAGGQLVARMACADVQMETSVRDRIARILPISPVSDLRPLMDTSMNSQLALDDGIAAVESPVTHQPLDIPVSVWVGAKERPVFLDQARWLADAWGAGHHVAPERHHFDVIEHLTDPDSPMIRDLFAETL